MRSDSQTWAQELIEGSHRYPKEWLSERYEWRDDSGVPFDPEWNRCSAGVKIVEDMAEVSVSAEAGERCNLLIWAKTPSLANGVEERHLTIQSDGEELQAKEVAALSKASIRQALADAVASMPKGVADAQAAEKKQSKKEFGEEQETTSEAVFEMRDAKVES